MTREEYLNRLLTRELHWQKGKFGPPLGTGSDEADAVARWIVGIISEQYGILKHEEPPTQPWAMKAWKYWQRDTKEDVDFVFIVKESGKRVKYQLKIEVEPLRRTSDGKTEKFKLTVTERSSASSRPTRSKFIGVRVEKGGRIGIQGQTGYRPIPF
jgi:hypothetical protein